MTNTVKIFWTIVFNTIIFLSHVSLYSKSSNTKVQRSDSSKVKSPLIYFEGTNIQNAVDSAQPFSTIIFNRNEQLLISSPILVKKPLILIGLNAFLPDSLGKTSILDIFSENVSVTDFALTGNANTVSQNDRAALINIYAGSFRIERGVFNNSSKDGVKISPEQDSNGITGGVIRDIVGRGCVRDVVSISGTNGENHACVKNILVENIRGYNSLLRGPVEVSDGSENITVRNIYAENCIYAVDWQDHNSKSEINRNVVINNVYALNCRYAIRNAVHDFGHSYLTITDITAENCEEPIKLLNTSQVFVQNIRIIGQNGNKIPFFAGNCHGLTVKNVTIENTNSSLEGIRLENCDEVLIDGITFLGNSTNFSSLVMYNISENKIFNNLRILNVCVENVSTAGITLEKENNATLENYIVSGNTAKIDDRINGKNAIISNNIASVNLMNEK